MMILDTLQLQQRIEVKLRPSDKLSGCLGWGGKIYGYALRLAGLLHIAEYESSEVIISDETITNALELTQLLIEHAIAGYGLMGIDQTTEDAKELFHWIVAQGKMNLLNQKLLMHMRNRKLGKAERLNPALETLIDRNILSELIEPSTYRKPITLFRVHPKVNLMNNDA